jgi:hypothetical protein
VTTPRCADTARERGDPPLGTAPVAGSFLLIEHPGPWRPDALAGAGWSPEVVDALTAAVRRSLGRLLLIRRPGRRPVTTTRAWAVTRVGVGTVWGTWQHEADLMVAAASLSAPPSTPPQGRSPASQASPEPVLLVCAHGVHDTCCAVRGRPVATALTGRWPAATWECSHVGGDRFAANVVVLPDGTYYGGLDADSATDVIADHLDGRLDPRHLRGSVRWPPAAQVAVGEIHRTRGPFAARDVRAESWTTVAPSRWLIEVSVPDGRRWSVTVAGERRPAARLTCAATQDTRATSYRVVAVGATLSPPDQVTI